MGVLSVEFIRDLRNQIDAIKAEHKGNAKLCSLLDALSEFIYTYGNEDLSFFAKIFAGVTAKSTFDPLNLFPEARNPNKDKVFRSLAGLLAAAYQVAIELEGIEEKIQEC